MNSIRIKAKDGYEIVGHIFSPSISKNKLIVINPATGVKQTFYYKYATYLSSRGLTVITYDYRGIGESKKGSLKGFKGSMTDWASLDFTAVSEYIFSKYPNYRKIVMGHSFGGNCLGLSNKAHLYDAYIGIAAQYGYWKNFNPGFKPLLLFLFYFAMPIAIKMIGYFPSRLIGLGEDLPAEVSRDWIIMITHKLSVLKLTGKTGDFYNEISKPFLLISFSDDEMAPKKAVDVLAERVYSNAKTERLHIKASKKKPIKHVNFFKTRFKDDLWNIPCNWIDQLQLNDH